MRYISTFSGIEAASVAWEPLGWEPVAFSEIDEFPSAVLAHRYPNVPNLGDITKVDWREVVERHGAVDVVVGGSPCQSFSLAGGRESLGGESRLMFEFIRACDEIRSPWIVWENVPAVLNTKDNAFGQLIDALQGIGYVSLAWRVLDAQFFGVAQRRRRVFLVGHLGRGGASAAVLFDRESVRGNNQSSKQKREALTRSARGGVAGDGGSYGFCGYASHTASSIGYADETAPTLKGNDWQSQVPDVLHAVGAIGQEAVMLKMRHTGTPNVGGGEGAMWGEGVSYTLSTRQDQTMFVPMTQVDSSDISVTIHDGSRWAVRRLTPTECERLQGFPDGWTDVPFRGKEHPSDTPRYKAIGNSMAVPVMRWIGERIEMADGIIKENES